LLIDPELIAGAPIMKEKGFTFFVTNNPAPNNYKNSE